MGSKKICCHTFFCSHKFHIIENYFIFEMLTKKIWTNFQRIIEIFSKNCHQALKNMGLGSRGQKSSGSRIRKLQKRQVLWTQIRSALRHFAVSAWNLPNRILREQLARWPKYGIILANFSSPTFHFFRKQVLLESSFKGTRLASQQYRSKTVEKYFT